MLNNVQPIWFIFQGDNLLVRYQVSPNEDRPSHTLVHEDDLKVLNLPLNRHYKIGKFNSYACHTADINSECVIPHALKPITLRDTIELFGEEWYSAAVKAYSVINWDRKHQFCGRCGHPTQPSADSRFERICMQCKLAVYPRISPSIIVLIRKGNELLMARSPHFPPGAYGLVAGFVEAGETLEATVHREVKEEVDIIVNNLRYFGSQPWPFPDSLMVGFMADYVSGEINIDPIEIESAGWYRFDALPGRPRNRISIASQLIDAFIKEQHHGNF